MNVLEFFANNPNQICKLSLDDVLDVITLACATIDDNTTSKLERILAMKALIYASGSEKLDVKLKWQIFWNVKRKFFVDYIYEEILELLQVLYKNIFNEIRKNCSILNGIAEYKKTNTIVIVISQMLGENHSATKSMLEFAYTIKHDLGYEVFLVNDAGMHIEPLGLFSDSVYFFYDETYSKISKIMYDEETFGIYQNNKLMLDLNAIDEMVEMIYRKRPTLVLSTGGCSIVADLCKTFTTTAAIPLSYDLPISMSQFLLLPRSVRQSDCKSIEELEAYQNIVETIYTYRPADIDNSISTRVTRESLGISNDSCVIVVVGNRLGEELTNDFANMIENCIDLRGTYEGKYGDMHIIFIGNLDENAPGINNIKDNEKVHLLGYREDYLDILGLCNIYVQPRRMGGGRSAYEAMKRKIPAVVPNYGDSWNVCGDLFAVENYEQMYERIKTYFYDVDIYTDACMAAFERACELEDMKGTWEKILSYVLGDL